MRARRVLYSHELPLNPTADDDRLGSLSRQPPEPYPWLTHIRCTFTGGPRMLGGHNSSFSNLGTCFLSHIFHLQRATHSHIRELTWFQPWVDDGQAHGVSQADVTLSSTPSR